MESTSATTPAAPGAAKDGSPVGQSKSRSAAMPLKIRLPLIALGIAILWWVMNGGARVLVDGFVEHVVRPDRSLAGAHDTASSREPEGTRWLDGLLDSATGAESPVPGLRGLECVVFYNGVRDASLPTGTHTGSFYDAQSRRAFFDTGMFATLDRFGRPRPATPKTYIVARTLALHLNPSAEGVALDEEAGRLAGTLGLHSSEVPVPAPGTLGLLAHFDKLRLEDLPKGWVSHRTSSLAGPADAAAAYARGLVK